MNKRSWISYGKTHIGNIRKINQDAFLNLPDKQLWIVADGMGGYKAGEFASAAIINALKTFTSAKTIGATVNEIYYRLLNVHNMLLEIASAAGDQGIIGSTVAILLVYQHHCVCLWSGDSRIYLFRRGVLKQISRDHNYASNLFESGISHAEAKAYPFAQTLTHAIGGEKELYLEGQIQETKQNDIFLICSDGLNKEVDDIEIASILNTTPIEQAVSQLIEYTLTRGARDNVTVVLVQHLVPDHNSI